MSDFYETEAVRLAAENQRLKFEAARLKEERDSAVALIDVLRAELRDRAVQAWCGCDHPACKRCRDDAMTERVLAKRATSSLEARDLRQQARGINSITHGSLIMPIELNLSMSRRAQELRQRADEIES